VIPVEDLRARAELLDVLDRSFSDNTNAWDLHEDGTWRRRTPGTEPRSVQRELIERHQARASETAH
jgi:polyphosphate kinase